MEMDITEVLKQKQDIEKLKLGLESTIEATRMIVKLKRAAYEEAMTQGFTEEQALQIAIHHLGA